MQSRRDSLIEQISNIGSGFVVSLLAWEFIVKPVWEINTSHTENLSITALFTVVSLLRSYAWRRFFNRQDTNKNKKVCDETTNRNNGPRP